MEQLFFAGLGGFLGSAARLWISTAAYRAFGQNFPYGTLVVNALGSFLIGFLMSVFAQRFLVNPNLRIFLTIGILGGFTTFSTFSFETVSLLQEGSYLVGSANICFSVAICLLLTWIGGIVGKLF